MRKFNRFAAIAATALLVSVLVGAAAPAFADGTTPPATPYPVTDASTYFPVLVTQTQDTAAYYAPGQITEDPLYAGQTWFVLGQDPTGQWLEIDLMPKILLWVPRSAMAIGKTPLPVVGS